MNPKMFLHNLPPGATSRIAQVHGCAYALLSLDLAITIKTAPVVLVAETDDAADIVMDDLTALNTTLRANAVTVISYPSGDYQQRIKCIDQLKSLTNTIILTTPAALTSPVFSPEDLNTKCFVLNKTGDTKPGELTTFLEDNGYTKTDFVDRPGDYAVRGGVVDTWPLTSDEPIRIIFDGNTVESINIFNTLTQRSHREIHSQKVIPFTPPVGTSTILSFLNTDTIMIYNSAVEDSLCDTLPENSFRRLIYTALITENDTCYPSHSIPPINGQLDILANYINGWQGTGYEVIIYSHNITEKERIEKLIQKYVDRIGNPRVTIAPLDTGCIFDNEKKVVISENDIFDRRKIRYRLPKYQLGRRLRTLSDLEPGDYVVHENYGIGIYRGVEQLQLGVQTHDFLLIQYLRGDTLHVPVSDFKYVQKYLAPDGHTPKVNSLDGESWERLKMKVSQAVELLAKQLIQTEASRKTNNGYSFPQDNDIELEFAESFPYEETEDQVRAIDDVKKAMSSNYPMDHFVIGDVGYGKTEVAMRAALKCVLGGKQTAILVPTTILAEQHYNTFIERYRKFPINIEMISRFRNRDAQKRILEDLSQKKVDILIATHRLLSKDVKFADLGLLIIDEEHRFGVRAKEMIKQLKTSVDVLTLSATPIPRSLSMALSGIRSISVIETPPEGRLPIETYVIPINEQVIRTAIDTELKRRGQVFYVHNRIDTIYVTLEHLRTLCPEVRFDVAHGQMSATVLEEVMHKFITREIDVLVSTSIIESGLDLPQVNTIIIEDADNFGLAQLYQLRGRIGRGDVKAYAYFLISPLSSLTEQARKRLTAIQEFTALGSGMRLAMRDLEIRGAGNILGQQQHGFITAVGYELYFRILNETIRRLRGEPQDRIQKPEITLEIPANAFLPRDYMPNPGERIHYYQTLINASTWDEITDLRAELKDKYGYPPKAAQELLNLCDIRVLCRINGLTGIAVLEKDDAVIFTYEPTRVPNPKDLLRSIRTAGKTVTFDPMDKLIARISPVYSNEVIPFIKSFLSNKHKV